MKIRINLKIFLFILIFIFTKQIKIYGIMMLFAFLHEMAHLVVGIILGLKVNKIDITPYGFSIGFKVNCTDYNKKIKKGNKLALKKIIIAFAGPLFNMIMALFFIFLYLNVNNQNIKMFIYANILIALFNMIPIYPLDGGRILKNIIYINFGLKKSYIIVNRISNITISIITAVSSILILYVKNIAIIFILIYLWYIVIRENRKNDLIMNVYEKYEGSI